MILPTFLPITTDEESYRIRRKILTTQTIDAQIQSRHRTVIELDCMRLSLLRSIRNLMNEDIGRETI